MFFETLLPDSGTDIKGHKRTYAELLDASGFRNRPNEFEGLIRLLDSEIRLITPTDLNENEESDASILPAGEKYYQLTHDYLVHSLRDWLTRKQRESRQGRAELLLEDRASVWSSHRENRHLPAWWEYAGIRLLTAKVELE